MPRLLIPGARRVILLRAAAARWNRAHADIRRALGAAAAERPPRPVADAARRPVHLGCSPVAGAADAGGYA